MEKIVLHKIYKKENVLSYDFSVSKGLSEFFSGDKFKIEYSENIESVPDAIAAIPFVSNVLPVIWLTNSSLVLKELDKAFYECMPELKIGYKKMFPESDFEGEILVDDIIENTAKASGKCAAFFSGGIDSLQTLIAHLDEKPTLISVWGSDIKYENSKGWEIVHRAIEEVAYKYDLEDVVIRSTFREFDKEKALDKKFRKQLKDGWWHGVKHGIGLLGHIAPYAFLHGLSTMYIASSNCAADGHVRCASNPLTDNQVRFVNCKVVHDGFEFNRQDKIHNIVEYCCVTQNYFPIHVCWKSQEGSNCCHCEKCYRTIVGILAEGDNPVKYGFEDVQAEIGNMQQYIIEGGTTNETLMHQWTHIQKRIYENRHLLKRKPYWKNIRWILNADFTHPEKLKMPLSYRIRRELSNFLFYQKLHELKVSRR